MKEYITFHQATLNKENIGIKTLFGLDKKMCVGIQQFSGTFSRNPKNPNQIEIPEKINIIESEYNKFNNPLEAYEVIETFIINELKINENSIKEENKQKELYFYVFEHDLDEETPIFRGVLYAARIGKPMFYVAFSKKTEFEYDKEIYKKWEALKQFNKTD